MAENSVKFNVIANVDQANKSVEKMLSGFKEIGHQSVFAGFADKTVGVVKTLGSGIAGALGAAVKYGAEFDDAMTQVEAVTGATGTQMTQLKNEAVSLGNATSFSAKEAAEGMGVLGQAGFSANQTMKVIPGVMHLAAISGRDVAKSAEQMTTAINGFQAPKSLKTATEYADVFAQAAVKSNAEANDMGVAFKYLAPNAHALGVSMKDSATSVMVLSDAGIKGAKAGTSMRQVFQKLSNPTKEATTALQAQNASIDDFYTKSGKLKSIPKVIEELASQTKNMNNQQKQSYLNTLFGVQGQTAMNALISRGSDAWNEYRKELDMSTGASDKLAAKMIKNDKQAFEQMKDGIGTVAIAFHEKLNKAALSSLKVMDSWFTGMATAVTNTKALKPAVDMIGQAFVALGNSLGKSLGGGASLTQFLDQLLTKIGRFAQYVRDNSDDIIAWGQKLLTGGLKVVAVVNMLAVGERAFEIFSAGVNAVNQLNLTPLFSSLTQGISKLDGLGAVIANLKEIATAEKVAAESAEAFAAKNAALEKLNTCLAPLEEKLRNINQLRMDKNGNIIPGDWAGGTKASQAALRDLENQANATEKEIKGLQDAYIEANSAALPFANKTLDELTKQRLEAKEGVSVFELLGAKAKTSFQGIGSTAKTAAKEIVDAQVAPTTAIGKFASTMGSVMLGPFKALGDGVIGSMQASKKAYAEFIETATAGSYEATGAMTVLKAGFTGFGNAVKAGLTAPIASMKSLLAVIGGGSAAVGAALIAVVAIIALFAAAWYKDLGGIRERVAATFGVLKEQLNSALAPIGGLKGAWEKIKVVAGVVGNALGFLAAIIGGVVTGAIGFLIQDIKAVILNFRDFLKICASVGKVLKDVFTGNFKDIGKDAKEGFDAAGDIVNNFKDTAASAAKMITNPWNAAGKYISSSSTKMGESGKSASKKVKDGADTASDAVTGLGKAYDKTAAKAKASADAASAIGESKVDVGTLTPKSDPAILKAATKTVSAELSKQTAAYKDNLAQQEQLLQSHYDKKKGWDTIEAATEYEGVVKSGQELKEATAASFKELEAIPGSEAEGFKASINKFMDDATSGTDATAISNAKAASKSIKDAYRDAVALENGDLSTALSNYLSTSTANAKSPAALVKAAETAKTIEDSYDDGITTDNPTLKAALDSMLDGAVKNGGAAAMVSASNKMNDIVTAYNVAASFAENNPTLGASLNNMLNTAVATKDDTIITAAEGKIKEITDAMNISIPTTTPPETIDKINGILQGAMDNPAELKPGTLTTKIQGVLKDAVPKGDLPELSTGIGSALGRGLGNAKIDSGGLTGKLNTATKTAVDATATPDAGPLGSKVAKSITSSIPSTLPGGATKLGTSLQNAVNTTSIPKSEQLAADTAKQISGNLSKLGGTVKAGADTMMANGKPAAPDWSSVGSGAASSVVSGYNDYLAKNPLSAPEIPGVKKGPNPVVDSGIPDTHPLMDSIETLSDEAPRLLGSTTAKLDSLGSSSYFNSVYSSFYNLGKNAAMSFSDGIESGENLASESFTKLFDAASTVQSDDPFKLGKDYIYQFASGMSDLSLIDNVNTDLSKKLNTQMSTNVDNNVTVQNVTDTSHLNDLANAINDRPVVVDASFGVDGKEFANATVDYSFNAHSDKQKQVDRSKGIGIYK